MSEDKRIEVRDGREWVVTTIPASKPRSRRKPMMTKSMARGIAVAKSLGGGPATQFRKRKKKGRRKGT